MTIRYLSLFSGVEAVSVAWGQLGWECAAVSEIEPFPCAVLAHHYPNVPNLGDVTKVTEADIKALGKIDIVVFGSPCQDLSVAGKRAGLKGERSGLFTTAMQIIKWSGCRFALWENVPGAFSSNKGDDFTTVVSEMAGLDGLVTPADGWAKEGAAVGDGGLLEWSVLDAQWFGVAQRRRRVFAILDTGDWASRPPILLERQSLRGDTAPSREAREGVTADVRASTASGGEVTTAYREGGFARNVPTDAAGTLRANGDGSESVVVYCGTQNDALRDVAVDRHAVAYGCTPTTLDPNKVNAITASYGLGGADLETKPLVMQLMDESYSFDSANMGLSLNKEVAATLCAHNSKQPQNVLRANYVVRRLTPIECEELQGFPPNFTKIPYRNKSADDCPNGVRYKALGNSMAVPVMLYIGQKIKEAIEYAAA